MPLHPCTPAPLHPCTPAPPRLGGGPALLEPLCTSVSAATNLVANGSFEAPNIVGGSYVLYTTASTAITGWSVLGPTAGDSVQLTPDTYLGLKASDGQQWVDMTGITGYDKGLRSDAMATTVGGLYHLSFDVGNYLPFDVSTLGVSINGGPEQLFVNTSLALTATNPMNWATFGFDWVATGSSAQLPPPQIQAAHTRPQRLTAPEESIHEPTAAVGERRSEFLENTFDMVNSGRLGSIAGDTARSEIGLVARQRRARHAGG